MFFKCNETVSGRSQYNWRLHRKDRKNDEKRSWELQKKVEELERKNDLLQLEKNELHKQKDNLLDEKKKDFDLKFNELQKKTSQKLKSRDATSVLKNLTINYVTGNQKNTAISWEKNQIKGSEIHANNKKQNMPSHAKQTVGKRRIDSDSEFSTRKTVPYRKQLSLSTCVLIYSLGKIWICLMLFTVTIFNKLLFLIL